MGSSRSSIPVSDSASQTFPWRNSRKISGMAPSTVSSFCVNSVHHHPPPKGNPGRTSVQRSQSSQGSAGFSLQPFSSHHARMVLCSLTSSEATHQEVVSHIAKINICWRYCLVSGEQGLGHFITSLVWSESGLPLWDLELWVASWLVAWKGQFPALLWRSLDRILFGCCYQLSAFARRKRKLKVCFGFLFGGRLCPFTNLSTEQISWLWNQTSSVDYGVLHRYQSIVVSGISSWKQSLWTVNAL